MCYRYGSRLSAMKVKKSGLQGGGVSNLRVVLSQGIFALDEVGVNGYFNSTKHSFIAGMMTTFAKGDNILVPQGWFRVEGCVEDENGEPLSGVVIYRKRKGKNFPECTTIDGGTFEFCLKRRRRLWFFKEGYQAQKMRIKKKECFRSSGRAKTRSV